MRRKLFILRSEHTPQECINVIAQEIIAREGQPIDLPPSGKGIEIQRYPRPVLVLWMLRGNHRVTWRPSNANILYLPRHILGIEIILVLRLLFVSVVVDRCPNVRQSLQGNGVRGGRLIFPLILRPGPDELATTAFPVVVIRMWGPRIILRVRSVKSRT